MNPNGMDFTQFSQMTSYDISVGCWECGIWYKYDDAPHPVVGKSPDGETQRQAAEQEWELVLFLTERGWSGDQQGHYSCKACTDKRHEEEGEDNPFEPPRRMTW